MDTERIKHRYRAYKTNKQKKTTQKPIMKRTTEEYMEQKYKSHQKIYTDASKESNQVGVGIFYEKNNENQSLRVTNQIAITSGELIAINEVLKELRKLPLNYENPICICTDSLGACQALIFNNEKQARQDITLDIIKNHTYLQERGINITLLWIPSHIDIEGNEIADRNANTGRIKEYIEIDCKLGYNETKSFINQMVEEIVYKKEILDNRHTKIEQFRRISPNILQRVNLEGGNKLLNRLRVGVTKFEQDNTELFCRICKTALTINHCLLSCKHFTTAREKLKDSFFQENVEFSKENILHTARSGKLLNSILKFTHTINKKL